MSDAPWLLVGLGNPGSKYANNRHNVGFFAVDQWLGRHGTPGASDWREKFHSHFANVRCDFGRCIVLKPQTYMNRSGKAVAAAAGFFQVPPEQLVVIHDELDFPFGRVAVKKGGGHGGHNGLRDIIEATGSRDFIRVRTGIGRPSKGNMDVSAWVLQDFGPDDAAELPDVVEQAFQAANAVMSRGLKAAMNDFNQTAQKEPKVSKPGTPTS